MCLITMIIIVPFSLYSHIIFDRMFVKRKEAHCGGIGTQRPN